MGWTEKDLAAYRARLAAFREPNRKPGASKAASGKPASGKTASGPNKTESRFNTEMLGGKGVYEALTFRLYGGDGRTVKYTPDWVRFDADGAIDCYEVKGAYRFPSENRARSVFAWASRDYPTVRWHWFRLSRGGQWVREAGVDSSGES